MSNQFDMLHRSNPGSIFAYDVDSTTKRTIMETAIATGAPRASRPDPTMTEHQLEARWPIKTLSSPLLQSRRILNFILRLELINSGFITFQDHPRMSSKTDMALGDVDFFSVEVAAGLLTLTIDRNNHQCTLVLRSESASAEVTEELEHLALKLGGEMGAAGEIEFTSQTGAC